MYDRSRQDGRPGGVSPPKGAAAQLGANVRDDRPLDEARGLIESQGHPVCEAELHRLHACAELSRGSSAQVIIVSTGLSKSPALSMQGSGNCVQWSVARASGATRASALTPATSWRQSTAGSPKDSTRRTSRRRRHSSRRDTVCLNRRSLFAQFESDGMSGFPLADHGAIDGHAMRATSSTFRRTTSQPRSLLWVARLNMAESRVRSST
jgi:hypothetical protein